LTSRFFTAFPHAHAQGAPASAMEHSRIGGDRNLLDAHRQRIEHA
jgi:hypothetical protein